MEIEARIAGPILIRTTHLLQPATSFRHYNNLLDSRMNILEKSQADTTKIWFHV